MILVRRIGRPMLASTFVVGGLDALRHPQTTSAVSESTARQVAARIPGAEISADTAVRINGGLMAAAGAMLAMGRMPRVASILLLASVVPPLVERARELKSDDKSGDPAERAEKRMELLGSIGVVGGLLIAAADTAGKPSLGRRAKYAGVAAQRVTKQARRELKHSAREAALAAKAASARLS